MKILIIVQTLGNGGAERVAVDVANGLSELGNDVAVLSNTDLPVIYRLNDDIQIYNNHKHKWIPRVINRFCVINAISLINTYKPDVVIGIMWGEALTAKLAMLFSRHKAPVIFSDHDCFIRPQGETIRRLFTKRILSRWCNFYTVLTEPDRKLCLEHNIHDVKVMNNPLSLKPIENIPSKKNVILAVGRLDAWHYKGFDILIKAWGIISKKYPKWKIEIAGDGTEKSKLFLQNLALENDCGDSVILSGHHSDMQSKYRTSAIFVLSSRYEGFGLVLTEAMSQGCACIACDYKGRQRDIITENVDGLLAETENIPDLSEKMELLIRDTTLRTRLQNNAPKNLERYSKNKVAENWDNLLSEIIWRRGN